MTENYPIKNGKVAILLHEGILGTSGKTGLAFLRYSEAQIVAVIDRQCPGKSLSELTGIPQQLPIVASVAEALQFAPDILLIGIAPSGGVLPPEWLPEINQAVAAGLSVVNGLHAKLAPLITVPLTENQWIWDVRQEPKSVGAIASAAAAKLSCRRVLTVGTDMSVGKMSTSLELNRTCLQRGWRSKFLATGQTGLMIGNEGLALDAVRVDFAAGAVEQMVLKLGSDCDILHVEGQGSLLHPGSTATLPLLRGAQPTHLILAHRAGQIHIRNHPHVSIPSLLKVVELYEMVAPAAGAFVGAKVSAIALNTHHLTDAEALLAIAGIQAETRLPCTDPVRFGADVLLGAIAN
ncbi:MAG: DUF1611 domain-containing protein [Microcoleus sp. PH2017_01_SCD_O_A]|uniref:DUF1611 domain-containing protein n=1 Tax=unclassified Microcoleus TaxID=2642155 RepID=UPI001DA7E6E5|nr:MULTISPECIES: DUF1611 domain-containing protein [unclassified Microcoleus]TAF87136.1 MAG: DUF1611 domain-containing protein [Oscillatoriales cyanobacterium]MCC3424358.1 DUF1611 domain-containing protein [Microcoleus sp. PH2017_01_SCD_O_A]MCC3439916.1 DUF1611 domain-containing protein [Microcoleus sp. PH2017_05_CCC_O_A]MCC3450434.1 DUF1611 domain-containing protein [Microcoleus sp. PH2017_09_SFU_O_A]MCC3571842.1 DUF1611 domain-containing protein [Microcoleus sp. PH2017_34_RAT_O_A]